MATYGVSMRNIKSQKFCGYQTYELFISPAFRDLKPASREILTLAYYEVKLISPKKGGKYKAVVSNRYNIKLPYIEIQTRLGYSQKTVWTAFKEILAHGFLEVVKNGGGCKGDCKTYKISEKWRE